MLYVTSSILSIRSQYRTCLKCLPFSDLTNAQLAEEIELPNVWIKNIVKDNVFYNYLKHAIPIEQLEYVTDCNYYDDADFNKKFGKNKDKNLLSIMHVNLQSSFKNFGKLKAHMQCLDVKFDVICISEAGPGNDVRCGHIFGNEYLYDYKPPTSKKGGVAIYINKNISACKRCDLELTGCNNIEDIWYELDLNGRQCIVGAIYRHPGYSTSEFCDTLKDTLCKVDDEKKVAVICGDTNIDLCKPNQPQTKPYIDLLLGYNAIPYIVLPTRVTQHSATIIDHINIMQTPSLLKHEVASGNLYMDIADHLPNFVLIKGINKPTTTIRPFKRSFSEKNIARFREDISKQNWEEVMNTNNPDSNYDSFLSSYKDIFNNCFPLKRISRSKTKDKSWITKGLKVSIKHKNRLYKKFLCKPTENNKLRYKVYRNKVTTVIRKREENYYSKLLTQRNDDTKYIWKVYRDIMNKNDNNAHKINSLFWKGQLIKGDKSISNAFNNYFGTVGSELAKSFSTGPDYKNNMNNPNPANMFLTPVTEEELVTEIMKLKIGKASGIDDIPAKIIKATSEFISVPLTHIYNSSFCESTVPKPLKIAKVVPIYKKGEKNKPNNYRPISLLSIFNKLLEKLMYKRVYSFFTKHNILNKYQFGFRKNHSTTLAIIEIVDKIREEMENGNSVIAIYLDLSKAFDLVNHEILLYKLNYYGVRGQVLDWFKSYLTDREQYTYINNTYSESIKTNIGVPQGSVLGPLLFLVYVNDIKLRINNTETRLFADDTNLFIFHKDLQILQQLATSALSELTKWFSNNKLTINFTKTCFSVFSNKNTVNIQKLTWDGNVIQREAVARYLGIYVDEKLSWLHHVNIVCKKLSKLGYVFRILAKHINHNQICQLYYAYVYPHIYYGIEVFGTCNKTVMQTLQVAQNNILRIFLHTNRRYSATEMHNKLGLLKISDVFQTAVLSFVYKQRCRILPQVFNDYYHVVSDRVTRSRKNNDLHIEFARTTCKMKSIKILGARLWNDLPSNIKEATCIKQFKKRVKHFKLNN